MAFRWLRFFLILAVVVGFVSSARADLLDWRTAKRHKILFLGDSNTFAGHYIAYVESYLRTRFPEQPWELINLGLPSETVSGLSEPDHPYPRPDVHERVDRALARIKPDVVFACYGMNDGIYYPFSEERLQKYKLGIESLVAKIEKACAKAVLMTPAPFDGTPVAKSLLTKDAPKFSWMKPYEKYDADVLRKYSDYLLEWRKKGYIVVDAHAAVHRYLKAVRAKEPGYRVSGDGIHPSPTGHAVIAFEILRTLKAPAEIDRIEVAFAAGKAKVGKGGAFEVMKDSMRLRFFGKWRMPIDPRWDKHLIEVEPYLEEFSRFPLVVAGVPPGKWEIVADKAVVSLATHDELAKGISITPFKDLKLFAETDKFGTALRERQRKMGLAWLTEIGHKRPDTPKGAPFEGAYREYETATREAQEMLRRANQGVFQEFLIRRVK